jgi:toxin FitB
VRALLDTCVLSELVKPDPAPSVLSTFDRFPDEHLFISVITLGEIGKGIALLAPGSRRDTLSAWLGQLTQAYAQRILPINSEIAALWGEITAIAQQQGAVLPAADGLIAATAIQHGLHLMTRNVKDFAATQVMLLNPWEPILPM